ncbi:MAG: hypothetical protein LBG88_02285 [Christensenellaceae bacterium]|jgi:hypothetical protein|nr:hypothetical protein [Christensenellaceae bacterium]
MFERQNDDKAIKYLRASIYCSRKERLQKYIAVMFSGAICLVSIFNSYLKFSDSQWLTLGSGAVIIINEFLLYRAKINRTLSASLMDFYDDYIYGLIPNRLLTKPIDPVAIESIAAKVRNRKKCRNYYGNPASVFESQYNTFASSYKMLLFARTFFYTIWLSFFVIILSICATFNDEFLKTLIKILIPSLSMIFLIVRSWQTLWLSLGGHQKCVNILNQTRKEVVAGESDVRLTDMKYLRSVQDAVFHTRCNNFTVPGFIQKFYKMSKISGNKEFSIRPPKKPPVQKAPAPKKPKPTPKRAPKKVAKKTKK